MDEAYTDDDDTKTGHCVEAKTGHCVEAKTGHCGEAKTGHCGLVPVSCFRLPVPASGVQRPVGGKPSVFNTRCQLIQPTDQ